MNFVAGLEKIRKKKDEFLEHLQEIKQIHNIIKEVQAGLKREKHKASKQVSYKGSKYAKVLSSNGFPDTTAKHLAKAMSAVAGEGGTFQQIFGNLPVGVE
eukprot:13539535-Heterocapsa_arctica.AAC.1